MRPFGNVDYPLPPPMSLLTGEERPHLRNPWELSDERIRQIMGLPPLYACTATGKEIAKEAQRELVKWYDGELRAGEGVKALRILKREFGIMSLLRESSVNESICDKCLEGSDMLECPLTKEEIKTCRRRLGEKI